MTKPTTRISNDSDAELPRRRKDASDDARQRSIIGFGEALANMLSFKS